MFDAQTLQGVITGWDFGTTAHEGRWRIEVEVYEQPDCVQRGAPVSIVLSTIPIGEGRDAVRKEPTERNKASA